jgi:cold shock protein
MSDRSAVVQGRVKWFNEQKGYGFIEQPDGRDLFVHYKECRGKLCQGDLVEYILGEGQKGPCATKVRVLERAATTPAE